VGDTKDVYMGMTREFEAVAIGVIFEGGMRVHYFAGVL
jgi:hypothetical protein